MRTTQAFKLLRTAVAVVLMIGLLPPTAWGAAKCKVLHSFGSGKDGSGPFGPPLLDGGGNLYGTTAAGGTGQCSDYGCGTVYELTPRAHGTWKESILHSFKAGNDGAIPWSNLVSDSMGNLYGTLQGDNGLGGSGVFQLGHASRGWDNALIYTDGAGPGLLIDGAGNLYGPMGPGEYKYYGAIGELSPGSDGWTYTALYSFCSTFCPDGFNPPAPPIWDGKGNMFGTTSAGGIMGGCPNGCGVIYEMTPNGDSTWTYHVLHRFASFKNDGGEPLSGLVMDQAGNLYGATWMGGRYDQGTVFKLAYTADHWKETILYDFPDCNKGCGVEGTLALDKSGNLYGTAAGGTGDCGFTCGVVFELSPQKNGKWKYNVVYDLTPETGGFQPFYGVIVDDTGNLFGVTSSGGKYGGGTAFEITP